MEVDAIAEAFKATNQSFLDGLTVTPIPVHHATKDMPIGRTMQLGDLAGAGIAEFARGWLLVNRLAAYDGTGRESLVMRFGVRPPLATGLFLAGLGLLLFVRLPVHGDYVRDVLPSMVLLGFGAGTHAAPPRKNGRELRSEHETVAQFTGVAFPDFFSP